MSVLTRKNLGRVLVADDDPVMCALCQATLWAEGWEVVVASDGEEALARVAESRDPFDCIVSDVNMPSAGGLAILDAMRARNEDIPVVLVTGDPSLYSAMAALNRGAVSYLTKPFDPDVLAEAVARAARRHGVARMQRKAAALLVRDETPEGLHDRNDLERRLDHAVEHLWIAFQPIIEIAGNRVVAYEALLRTDEPSLRRPDVLLGVAERLGRIHEVGRQVRAAVARAVPNAPRGVELFVNLHGLELNDEELFSPSSALTQVAPRVVLELTERLALDQVADTAARVAMLRKLGFRIAIDDLGGGYAGLGSLAALEPDVTKLDISLIRGLDAHPTKRRVVGAMSTLCKELGVRVVAEGVETEAELAAVREAGVGLAQGYLFARPEPGFPTVTLP